MLDFNYDEIELISKILNFKIINKKEAFENKIITEKNFKEKLKTVNHLLNAEKLGQIIQTKDSLFYFGIYDKNALKWKAFFKFVNSIRKEIVYLFLLLSSRKFNIMRFGEKFWENNDNRTTLKSDLRFVLNSLDIEYKKYMLSSEPAELIKVKINKFEKVRQEYVKNILLKRWERVYNGIASKPEIVEMEVIQEELEIKHLKYMYEQLEEFFYKYGRMNSKSEKYGFFTYLILNLRNEKINLRKRVTSSGVKLKKENNFKLLDDMLRKISEKEEKKIKVVMVYDLENTEISKNIENLKKIPDLMDITRIYRFDEFEREQLYSDNKEEEEHFDQILIVSNDEIQNTVINYSEKPISFLKLSDREADGKKKSRFKKNAEFYNNLKIIDNMMKEYEKMCSKK